MENRLIAFHVWDSEAPTSEEASHEIVFAETSGKAKYQSEAYSMSGEYVDIKAKRIPEFDKYADTMKVPMSEMVKHGWMFECEICFSFTGDDDNCLIIDEQIYCESCKDKALVQV